MQYRFTKDLPPTHYKKGNIFEDEEDPMDTALLLHIGIIEEVLPYSCKHGSVACNDCMKQDKEWPKTSLEEWTKPWPQIGDEYWYFDSEGEIYNHKWKNEESDKASLAFGNCFRTENEAIRARESVHKLLKGE